MPKLLAILSTHLLHEFIDRERKVQNGRSYRKAYICLSFNFFKQYSANGMYMSNFCEYVPSF